MRGAGKKNTWALVLLIMVGLVLGGFISSITEGIPALNWLAYGQSFGLEKPIVLNIGILVLTFGCNITITMGGIIGVILAIFIYRKL